MRRLRKENQTKTNNSGYLKSKLQIYALTDDGKTATAILQGTNWNE